MDSERFNLAYNIAGLFSRLPQVKAVALSGSCGIGPGTSDHASDIDLYVYSQEPIPLETRQTIIKTSGGAPRTNLNFDYWGSGDEWINAVNGIEVDCMRFEPTWMQNQITQVMLHHQPKMGYTTCFCYTVSQSVIFYDPHNWFADLQKLCQSPYPEALRRNIITFNYPLLHKMISSYSVQIEKAARRGDLVSLNHRIAALLASYFDILFALNRQLHPGEKRLVDFLHNNCSRLPAKMDRDLQSLLCLSPSSLSDLPRQVSSLIENLDNLLTAEGFAPSGLIPDQPAIL